MHEKYTEALQAWNLNSQKLLSVFGVPYSDFIERGSCEDIREIVREANIINFFVMTGISQFWSQGRRINPIDIRLRSTAEEVGVISGEGNGGDCSHNFVLLRKLHCLYRNPA